ncbi:hypothetical protein D3C75_528900 [compost metagenome]
MSAVNGKAKELGMPARIEVFKLIAQNPHKKLGFVKEKISFNNPDEIHSIEFKGVSEVFFAQAYKKYFNLDIQQEDLMYYHEGQLARFLEPIKES